MKYIEFATELVRFPRSRVFRTDLATLHAAFLTILEREGLDKNEVPDISDVRIVDNQEARDAIANLANYLLRKYGTGDGYFSDITPQFMLGKLDIMMSSHGSTPRDVSIDITLVHSKGLQDTDSFIEMQAALTSEQVHRGYC